MWPSYIQYEQKHSWQMGTENQNLLQVVFTVWNLFDEVIISDGRQRPIWLWERKFLKEIFKKKFWVAGAAVDNLMIKIQSQTWLTHLMDEISLLNIKQVFLNTHTTFGYLYEEIICSQFIFVDRLCWTVWQFFFCFFSAL